MLAVLWCMYLTKYETVHGVALQQTRTIVYSDCLHVYEFHTDLLKSSSKPGNLALL